MVLAQDLPGLHSSAYSLYTFARYTHTPIATELNAPG